MWKAVGIKLEYDAVFRMTNIKVDMWKCKECCFVKEISRKEMKPFVCANESRGELTLFVWGKGSDADPLPLNSPIINLRIHQRQNYLRHYDKLLQNAFSIHWIPCSDIDRQWTGNPVMRNMHQQQNTLDVENNSERTGGDFFKKERPFSDGVIIDSGFQ